MATRQYDKSIVRIPVSEPVDDIPVAESVNARNATCLTCCQGAILNTPWLILILYFCVTGVVTWWLFDRMIWWASPVEACAQWATPVSSA